MAQQVINVGSVADDHTGDPERSAWIKTNANFTELYAAAATGAFRTVSGTTDTPTTADNGGFIAYTSASAITVTANDLGAGKSYSIQQQGAGRITVAAGGGVTLASDHGSPTYQTSAQWSVLTVIGTGTGTVAVVGSML